MGTEEVIEDCDATTISDVKNHIKIVRKELFEGYGNNRGNGDYGDARGLDNGVVLLKKVAATRAEAVNDLQSFFFKYDEEVGDLKASGTAFAKMYLAGSSEEAKLIKADRSKMSQELKEIQDITSDAYISKKAELDALPHAYRCVWGGWVSS